MFLNNLDELEEHIQTSKKPRELSNKTSKVTKKNVRVNIIKKNNRGLCILLFSFFSFIVLFLT